jgi:hypothetical protein
LIPYNYFFDVEDYAENQIEDAIVDRVASIFHKFLQFRFDENVDTIPNNFRYSVNTFNKNLDNGVDTTYFKAVIRAFSYTHIDLDASRTNEIFSNVKGYDFIRYCMEEKINGIPPYDEGNRGVAKKTISKYRTILFHNENLRTIMNILIQTDFNYGDIDMTETIRKDIDDRFETYVNDLAQFNWAIEVGLKEYLLFIKNKFNIPTGIEDEIYIKSFGIFTNQRYITEFLSNIWSFI